jgi:dethiobiotin synthetase
LREIADASDVVLVEDSHGLAARLDARRDFADLAFAHRLQMILVVAHRPGFAESARRALQFAAARGIVVRGAVLNALDQAANEAIARDAEALASTTGTRILGTMRFKEPLSLAIVDQVLGVV